MDYKPKILFVLGYPRSGSTVFGEVLGKLENFIHVGEMERVFYPRKDPAAFIPQKHCSCNERLYSCNFWKPYFDEMESEIRKYNKETDGRINTRELCRIKEQYIQKEIENEDTKRYAHVIYSLYKSLQIGEDKIVIDTSKELWYAKFLEDSNLFEVSYIHLVRDIRGVVYSRQKKLKNLNAATGKVSLNYKYLIYDTLKWNITNNKIAKFLKTKRSLIISYSDFVSNANETAAKVHAMYFDTPAANVVNDQNEFTTSVNHLIHGNRFRFERGTIKLNKDSRWINEVKAKDKLLIKKMSWFSYS